MKSSSVSGLFAIAIVLVLISDTAFAYLDPGTGSILLQGLIAAVAAGLATAKFWWHRFLGLFSRAKETETDSSPGSDEEQP